MIIDTVTHFERMLFSLVICEWASLITSAFPAPVQDKWHASFDREEGVLHEGQFGRITVRSLDGEKGAFDDRRLPDSSREQ